MVDVNATPFKVTRNDAKLGHLTNSNSYRLSTTSVPPSRIQRWPTRFIDCTRTRVETRSGRRRVAPRKKRYLLPTGDHRRKYCRHHAVSWPGRSWVGQLRIEMDGANIKHRVPLFAI